MRLFSRSFKYEASLEGTPLFGLFEHEAVKLSSPYYQATLASHSK